MWNTLPKAIRWRYHPKQEDYLSQSQRLEKCKTKKTMANRSRVDSLV